MVDYTTLVRHSRIRALGPFDRISTAGVQTDWDAIWQDWQRIGDDMRSVLPEPARINMNPVARKWSTPEKNEAGLREKIERVQAWAAADERWDPIAPEIVDKAVDLIERMLNNTGMRFHEDAVPHVSSDGEGGVTFEWWGDKRTLTLYQRADGSTGILLAWGVDIDSEMESIDDPTWVQMTLAWGRFRFGETWP